MNFLIGEILVTQKKFCFFFYFHAWVNVLTEMFVFQFVGLEALATGISDMNPSFFHVGARRELLLLAISVVSFFIGLVMVTEVRYKNLLPHTV